MLECEVELDGLNRDIDDVYVILLELYEIINFIFCKDFLFEEFLDLVFLEEEMWLFLFLVIRLKVLFEEFK